MNLEKEFELREIHLLISRNCATNENQHPNLCLYIFDFSCTEREKRQSSKGLLKDEVGEKLSKLMITKVLCRFVLPPRGHHLVILRI